MTVTSAPTQATVALRGEWEPIVRLGMTPCSVCGHPIAHGETWTLDPDHPRSRYRGPAHTLCAHG